MLNQIVLKTGKRARRIHGYFGHLFGVSRAQYARGVAWWLDRTWAEPYRKFLARDHHGKYADENRILDRRFQLIQFAKAVTNVPGSTAECGVYRGVWSGLLCRTLEQHYAPGEFHFGFDSFAGMPNPVAVDSMANGECRWREGQLATPYEATAELLAEFAFCRLMPG